VSLQKKEFQKQQKKQQKLLYQQHKNQQEQSQQQLSQSLKILNVPNIISTIKTIQNRVWNDNEKKFLQQFRLWSPICDLKVVLTTMLDQRKILHDR